MPNGRCRLHGGLTPIGIGSANFKHGRYSKQLPERMLERYQVAAEDPELLSLNEEVRLIDARLGDLLERVDTGESGNLWKMSRGAFMEFREANTTGDRDKMSASLNELGRFLNAGVSDYAAWDEIGRSIEQRRKLVESERKRLEELKQMITVGKMMVLLSAVIDVIRKHVTNRKTLSSISREIGLLISEDAVRRIES